MDDRDDDNLVQLTFEVPQEDGWPPVSKETVLAEAIGEQRFELKSTPYFVRYLSRHDVVFAKSISEHEWLGLGLCQRSGHSAVRVLPHSDAVRHKVCTWLEQRDCTTQYHDGHGLVAVDIPADIDTQGVLDFLFERLDEGVLEFETGWLGE
jgi:hypothetical protein